MSVVTLFLLWTAVQASSSAVPPLTITAVLPAAQSDVSCSIQLENRHSRAAVAWVVEALPSRQLGSAVDFALAPNLRLQPNSSTTMSFQCDGETPYVAAVLYDDNSFAGDAQILQRTVLSGRLRRAAGLRELVQLVKGLTSGSSSSETALRKIITNSAGPSITSLSKAEANRALDRALGGLGRSRTSSVPISNQLLLEMEKSIHVLEGVKLPSGGLK